MELIAYRNAVLAQENAVFFDVTDSTNTQAKARAREGAADSVALFANAQTAGRGRLSRSWQSEENRGIYMSLITREPSLPAIRTPELSFWAALAVCDAIDSYLAYIGCDKRTELKWPNDVILDGKKVCGILAETGLCPDGTVDWAVTGIGINVNGTSFPPELPWATSIEMVCGRQCSRAAIATELLSRLTYWKGVWRSEGFAPVRTACEGRMLTIGRRVRAECDGDAIVGEAIGLSADGSLLLRTEEGDVLSLSFGEVSVRGMMGYI